MSIQDRDALEVARKKLRWLEEQVAGLERRTDKASLDMLYPWLEERLASLGRQPGEDPYAHDKLRLFKKLINQLKEEIARFEAHANPKAEDP
jgi:hypothetical protein